MATTDIGDESPARHKVELRVYDISAGMAKNFAPMLLGKQLEGIWHTGVTVYGLEFYFGGGICSASVGEFESASGLRALRVHEMGYTGIEKELFFEYLDEISPRFTMQSYDIIEWNCNNFSQEVCNFLIGSDIPSYITDLPREVLQTELGKFILPLLKSMQSSLGGRLGFDNHVAAHSNNSHAVSNLNSATSGNVAVSTSRDSSDTSRGDVTKDSTLFHLLERLRVTVSDLCYLDEPIDDMLIYIRLFIKLCEELENHNTESLSLYTLKGQIDEIFTSRINSARNTSVILANCLGFETVEEHDAKSLSESRSCDQKECGEVNEGSETSTMNNKGFIMRLPDSQIDVKLFQHFKAAKLVFEDCLSLLETMKESAAELDS